MPKGLNSNFSLDSTGAFVLTEGAEKSYDEVKMLACFETTRVYYPDYNPGFMALQQKNASYLIQFEPLITGRFIELFNKYVNNLDLLKVEIVQSNTSRRDYGILIEYKYPQQPKTALVTFIG